MAIASINPTTGAVLKTFAPLTGAEIEQKLARSAQAFQEYRHQPLDQRAAWLQRAADVLVASKEEYGRIMTLEMGKPLIDGIAEVEKSAWVCRYYAEHGAEFLTDVAVATDARRSFVRYQPLGPILAVMPWNFPFWQVFRFAAPALMAGNVGLLKHASNVPQSALAIEAVFRDAGLPEGVFQSLLVGAQAVAPITGSEPAGISLAITAGKEIKKTVLELGGSDPFIVLESADLDAAIATAVKARMINNGQSCIAAKRFIVADAIADKFQAEFVKAFAALRLGDPLLPTTQIGPLATPKILADIAAQVEGAVALGAKVLVGGKVLQGSDQLPFEVRQGNFYAPTILADVTPDNPAFREEFFGPVAMLFRVQNLDQAIEIANATPFGLGSSAWTCDPAEQERLIDELEAGAVFINGMVKSDPRMPFGGVKRSGYGRELGAEGIREFLNIKTVWVQ
jgi:succinate-semialdehyde dehydrogenase / glutarate-semialdehyde dehydrogenase